MTRLTSLFGKYHFETEHPAGGAVVSNATTRVTGGVAEERFEYRAGGMSLLLAGGRLILNGADRGAVSPGDRIKLTADGRLLVNDQERRGP